MGDHKLKVDKNFFFHYHQSTGHSTEVCWKLKDLIEKNVQNRELIHYVAGRERPTPQQDDGRIRQLGWEPDRDVHPR